MDYESNTSAYEEETQDCRYLWKLSYWNAISILKFKHQSVVYTSLCTNKVICNDSQIVISHFFCPIAALAQDVVFGSVDLSVCLFVCKQHYWKHYGWIAMTSHEGVSWVVKGRRWWPGSSQMNKRAKKINNNCSISWSSININLFARTTCMFVLQGHSSIYYSICFSWYPIMFKSYSPNKRSLYIVCKWH